MYPPTCQKRERKEKEKIRGDVMTSLATTPVFETMFIHACIVASLSIETVTCMLHPHFSASRLVYCGRKGVTLRVKSHMHLSTHQGHERCDAMWWHHGVLKQCASMSCCCYKSIPNSHMHHSSKLEIPPPLPPLGEWNAPFWSIVSRYVFRVTSHAHVSPVKEKNG
jgi:hypothetical protein